MNRNQSDAIEPVITGEVLAAPYRLSDGWRMPLEDPLSMFAEREAGVRCLDKPGASKVFEDTGFIHLDDNMVVNLGRQTIANLIGGRDFDSAPNNWVITTASFGTFDEAARFDDVSLSPQPVAGSIQGGANEILYNGVDAKKPITSVDWPQPFIIRFEINLEPDEANGFLIREMGLWTDNGNLFARKTFPGINKISDFGVSFLWRIRS
jgi:hypothetical protein